MSKSIILSPDQYDAWKFLQTFHKSCSFYHLVEQGLAEIKAKKPITVLDRLKKIDQYLTRNNEDLIRHHENKYKGKECGCVYCKGTAHSWKA
jgi:hypothetical protein